MQSISTILSIPATFCFFTLHPIRTLFRQLYDRSDHGIHYEEGQRILDDLIEPSRYPKSISMDAYTYDQRLKFYE